jgi:hypothetical protein
MRSETLLLILLTLTSILLATTSAEYVWNGSEWVWKEKEVKHHLPGLNLINVIRAAFTLADPVCAKKKTVKLAVSFDAFETYERKSCT